jgi:hypothetical protein
LRIAACVLLSLSGASFLAGCDVIEKIPLTPADVIKAADQFGLTTRELVDETPEGKVYRLMVESRRPANWAQADFAMFKQLRHSCPDGEPHVTLSSEPATDDSHEDIMRQLPAGTLFVRTVRCHPRPPFEFEFDGRLSHPEALAVMKNRLSGAEPWQAARFVVQPIHSFGPMPKYEQVETLLGMSAMNHMFACPAGVLFSHLQLGMFRPSDAATHRDEAAGYFGFVLECAPDPVATASSAPDAGS